MKKLILLSIILIVGCSSISNQGKSNNLQIDEINIPTTQCNMCVANIENALNGIDGILKYKVELETYRVKVKFNTDKLSLQSIEQLISKAGYQANNLSADVDAYNKLAMCCRLPKDRL
jgi:mercuric ion binding protein